MTRTPARQTFAEFLGTKTVLALYPAPQPLSPAGDDGRVGDDSRADLLATSNSEDEGVLTS